MHRHFRCFPVLLCRTDDDGAGTIYGNHICPNPVVVVLAVICAVFRVGDTFVVGVVVLTVAVGLVVAVVTVSSKNNLLYFYIKRKELAWPFLQGLLRPRKPV